MTNNVSLDKDLPAAEGQSEEQLRLRLRYLGARIVYAAAANDGGGSRFPDRQMSENERAEVHREMASLHILLGTPLGVVALVRECLFRNSASTAQCGAKWIVTVAFLQAWNCASVATVSVSRSTVETPASLPLDSAVTIGGIPVVVVEDKDADHAHAHLVRVQKRKVDGQLKDFEVVLEDIQIPMPAGFISMGCVSE